MSFLKIAVFVLAGVILLALARRNAPLLAILCELALVCVIVINILPEAEKLLSLFDSFEGVTSISEAALKIMLKSMDLYLREYRNFSFVKRVFCEIVRGAIILLRG